MAEAHPEELDEDRPACDVEELRQNICDLCIHDQQRIAANAYCPACMQYICLSCQKSHERANATKMHKMLIGENMPHKGSDISTKPSLAKSDSRKQASPRHDVTKPSVTKPSCPKHSGKIVEYFCFEHMVRCCGSCKVLEHQTCNKLEYLEKLTADETMIADTPLKVDGLRCILAEFERLEQISGNRTSYLDAERIKLITKFKDIRAGVNKHLDKLEESITKETKIKINSCVLELKKQLTEMNSVKSHLAQRLKSYEELKKKDGYNQVELALVSETIHAEMLTFVESLTHIYGNFHTEVVVFQPNKSLQEFDRYISSFGELTVGPTNAVIRRSYKERQAVFLGYDSYWREGESEFYTADVNIMPHGGLLLFDRERKRLKLFNTNYEVMSEMDVASEPWSVAIMSSMDAFVALPRTKTILAVTISRGRYLLQDKAFKTKIPYYKLAKCMFYGSAKLFAIGMDDVSYYFDLIDKHGKLINRIRTEQRSSLLFTGITTLCISSDNKTVFITDTNNGCIGLSMSGDILFRYKDEEVQNYRAVCSLPEGLLAISGCDTNNLIILDEAGNKVKELVNHTDLHPCALAYRVESNKLYVSHSTASTITLFALL